MANQPLVSVIIPFYNRADVIRATLDSVLHQTFRDFELICVDDGSTDDVPQILNNYAQKDPRVKVILKPLTDSGDTRNVGYQHSVGKYVFFLDSDDLYEPNYFEIMVTTIQKEDADVVICKYDEFNHHTNQFLRQCEFGFGHVNFNQKITTLPRDKFVNFFFQAPFSVIWNKIFKREIIAQHHLQFRNIYPDDIFFNNQYLIKCQRFTFHNTVLIHHRVNDCRSSVSSRPQTFNCYQEYEYVRSQFTPAEFAAVADSFYLQYFLNSYADTQIFSSRNRQKLFQRTRKMLSGHSIQLKGYDDYFLFLYWVCLKQNDFRTYHRFLKLLPRETTPELCIIMPFYNRADVITQTLDSLRCQTFLDWQLIGVDDGSTDNVPQILAAYAAKDARIQILRKRHTNAGDARNLGLRHSTGKYVMFLDADDILEPDYLATMVKLIKQEQSDVVICKNDDFDHLTQRPGRTFEFINIALPQEITTLSLTECLDKVFIMTRAAAWNKIFRRSLIEQLHLRFQSLNCLNDQFFVFYYLLHSQKITFYDRVLIHHRVNDRRSTSHHANRQIDTFNYCRALDYLRRRLKPDLFARIAPAYNAYYLQKTYNGIKRANQRQGYRIFQHTRNVFQKYGVVLHPDDPKLQFYLTCLQQNNYPALRQSVV